MKKLLAVILALCLLPLSGCREQQQAQIVATTKPVYDFTAALCQGTDLTVSLLVTEQLSCLHDYTLQVRQMRAIEAAQTVVISGAGLESFLEDVLGTADFVIDSAAGIDLHCSGHEDTHEGHHHENDPHIWLSVDNARTMAQNIYHGLAAQYPGQQAVFAGNLSLLNEKFDKLEAYGAEKLAELDSRELITFHDGFSYFADDWGLRILHSLEEESGSEASAGELKELITLVRVNQLSAIFIEENSSASAACTVAAETGIEVHSLSMGMSEKDYFETMYHNIDTVKEALG